MSVQLTEQSAVRAVEAAQTAWGEGIVAIGAGQTWEDSYALATAFVKKHYQLDGGALLFCPTKAAESQFRSTLKDAVSYFVGRDSTHAEDQGFALQPWRSVRFENTGVVPKGDVILTMGNYFFQPLEGDEVKVEYSFVYEVAELPKGTLKILLHHSALPYAG